MRGLKSPYGSRGAICAYFGWRYDYLLHGIPWAIVQRMMVDAPSYDYNANGEEQIPLTQDNNEQIMNYINSLM